MEGKSPVLPAEPWIRSSVTEKKLQELVCDGLLRPRISRDLPEWRVPPTSHQEPAPPGLRVPLSYFMRAIPHYYEVELHHLAPNSIS
jgi:hypothetical protein